jgi:hypothetical protein
LKNFFKIYYFYILLNIIKLGKRHDRWEGVPPTTPGITKNIRISDLTAVNRVGGKLIKKFNSRDIKIIDSPVFTH